MSFMLHNTAPDLAALYNYFAHLLKDHKDKVDSVEKNLLYEVTKINTIIFPLLPKPPLFL